MSDQPIAVVGAGPAGLAAAIELARHRVPVVVYERHAEVGGRFHGDFQGIENWTTEEDALSWLGRLGIHPLWPHRPIHEVTLVDPDLVRWPVRADRPLLYLVERGPGPRSLDRALRAAAESLGVQLRLRVTVRPWELRGPVILATGPRETRAVVAGILAETSHPDQVVAIAKESLAPKCYAYCVIWEGRATVAAALARDFRSAWKRFERARAVFAHLGLSDFRNERRFGGRADVCGPAPGGGVAAHGGRGGGPTGLPSGLRAALRSPLGAPGGALAADRRALPGAGPGSLGRAAPGGLREPAALRPPRRPGLPGVHPLGRGGPGRARAGAARLLAHAAAPGPVARSARTDARAEGLFIHGSRPFHRGAPRVKRKRRLGMPARRRPGIHTRVPGADTNSGAARWQ